MPEHVYRRGRNRGGFTRAGLLVLLLAAGTAIFYIRHWTNASRAVGDCEHNLSRIYRALERYETEHGRLPRMAYFADEPMSDEDSIVVTLESLGASPDCFVCPGVRPRLRKLGLTYIWNTALNNQPLPHGTKPRAWMLVEMTALSADIGAPHPEGYNVLYTDGSIQHLRRPLGDALPGL